MSQTSFALPARQVTFGAGRSQYQQQQAQQAQQQAQAAQQAQQQQQQASQYYRQSGPGGGLALPGPGPATQAAQKAATAQPSSFATPAGPSTPAATAVPATPAPLTLEPSPSSWRVGHISRLSLLTIPPKHVNSVTVTCFSGDGIRDCENELSRAVSAARLRAAQGLLNGDPA